MWTSPHSGDKNMAAVLVARPCSPKPASHPEGWTDTAFSYSLNGNMTQSFHTVHGTTVYAWDADNHLTGISNAAVHVALEYDPFGYLIRVEENQAQTFLLRDYADPLKRPLAQLDADGNTIRCFVWSNGRLIAQVEADGTVRYAHFDELGHLLALSDAAGSVTDQFAYDPHGTVLARTGSTSTPFTWLGAYGVVSLGHDYYSTLHRTYNAGIKRWLSEDPSGLDGGANLYAYAVNPLFAIDPTGLHPSETGGFWEDVLTRAGGGLQMVWGIAEIAGGISFGTATSVSGAGAVAGAAVATLGVDNFQAGARTMLTGNYADTMLSQGLQDIGLSRSTANITSSALDLAAGGGVMAANAFKTASAVAPAGKLATIPSQKTVEVSRWGREGLQPGDWVMKGPANRWNYLMSGKYQPEWVIGKNTPAPYSVGQTFTVPQGTLKTPPGFLGPAKSILGQRIYSP